MKKILILLTFAMLVVLASCKNKGTYRSPSITFGNILLNHKEITDNVIHVGDTLEFYMLLNAYYSSLTNFNVVTDRSFLKDSVMSDADFEKLCNVAASNRATGMYTFKELGEGVSVGLSPLYIVAVKSPNSDDKTVMLSFQLKNDSPLSGEYNPVTYPFKLKVLEKEVKNDEE